MANSHYTTAIPATILIVDDYPDALDVLEIFLRAEGFNVLTAGDGPSALALAIEAKPDVIVMDLELPGLSGFQVAQALRSTAATSHIPIIAATGYSRPNAADEARQSGFDAFMVKPCDPAALVAEINRQLAASFARRAASSE